jgi:hypothetical protein
MFSACGFVNNLNTIKNNLKEDLTAHPLKVKDADKENVLSSGMGIVEMYFGKNVETTWRKIEDNGSIGSDVYKLTYFGTASSGRVNSKLEPGTYFLDGVRFNEGNLHIRSGSSSNTIQNKVYGWDSDKNEAKCFSFTLRAGEELIIPDVATTNISGSKDDTCPHLRFIDDNVVSDLFKIGPLSK